MAVVKAVQETAVVGVGLATMAGEIDPVETAAEIVVATTDDVMTIATATTRAIATEADP